MGSGVWQDSEKLNPEDTLEKVLKHGTLTIGFIGLSECLIALTGKHHAESKPHTGERGAQAVLEWLQSCDRDTDLYVFAHGSSIAQTITYLLGGRSQHTEIMYENLIPMNNAFWAVMVPQMHRDGHISWTLVSYNEGPEIAHHLDWDRDEQ